MPSETAIIQEFLTLGTNVKRRFPVFRVRNIKVSQSLRSAKAFLGENEQNQFIDEPKERKSTAVAYVDGSYNISTKEYACGVIIFYEGKETTFSRKFSNPENASMRNVAGEIEGWQNSQCSFALTII